MSNAERKELRLAATEKRVVAIFSAFPLSASEMKGQYENVNG